MKKLALMLVLVAVLLIPFASAEILTDSAEDNFNSGDHENTQWDDNEYVRLAEGNITGTFVSRILESDYESAWQRLEWGEALYYSDPLPDNKERKGGINMTGNRLLYHMDETSGNEVKDYSGNGLKGEIKNSIELGAEGKFGYAFGFDEDAADHISLPSTAVNDLTNFTFEVWIKTVKKGNQAIISGANSDMDNEWLLFLDNDVKVTLYLKNVTYSHAIPSIGDNKWHHIVWVRDVATSRQIIYVDGIERGSNSVPITPVDIDVGGLILGEEQDIVGDSFSSVQSFEGYMDEVAVYERAITSTEVLSHYKQGVLDLKLQIRSSNDKSEWKKFIGPDATENTYFTKNFNTFLTVSNSKYFQYKVYFSTEDSTYTPKLLNVTITYERSNQKPTRPVLTSPENGAVLSSRDHVILEYNSTDAEGSEIYHSVYVSKTSGFKPDDSNLVYYGKENKYSYKIDDYGNYYWRVIATDGQLNSTPSVENSFTMQIDLGQPVIINETIWPSNITKGLLATFNATITDASNLTVWLNVKNPDNETLTYSMFRVGETNIWEATFIPIILGNYSYKINASDNYGNKNNDRYWIEFSVYRSKYCDANGICDLKETYINCAYDCCRDGETKTCGSSIGACQEGTRTCGSSGNWAECVGEIKAEREVCANAIDDDCDGIIDFDCVSDVICSGGKIPVTGCRCENRTYIDGYCYENVYSEKEQFVLQPWAVIAIIIGIIFLVFAIIWHYKNKIFKKKPKHQEQPKPKEHPKEKP
ncbi:MAG: LamG domain-containing protein, partial [Nanoarchaeota archaeon]